MRRTLFGLSVLMVMPCFAFAAPEQEKFFDSDGVKIRYWDEGEGEVVLLIHGFSATGTLNWRAPKIQQALSENNRVIMPDVRNHGKTGDAPEGEHGVEVVKDMVRLLDHIGVDRAHVVGYSMGGMIAIKMTTMYPERVQSILSGGMGWMEAGSDEVTRFANSGPTGRLGPPYHGFAELGTSAAEMKAITTPLKVIIGTEDGGQHLTNAWKEIVPDLDIVYVEGANHQSCVVAPEFKAGIQKFIAENAEK